MAGAKALYRVLVRQRDIAVQPVTAILEPPTALSWDPLVRGVAPCVGQPRRAAASIARRPDAMCAPLPLSIPPQCGLAVGTEARIYRSRDHGATWRYEWTGGIVDAVRLRVAGRSVAPLTTATGAEHAIRP